MLILGLCTGAFGVAVGTGGGIILVPMLLIFTGLDTGLIAGTSLALVSVNSFSGMLAYRRLGLVDIRSGLLFAISAIPGSVGAPFVVGIVSGGVFRALFGAILIGVAAHMTISGHIGNQSITRGKILFKTLVASRKITTTGGHVYEYEFDNGLATAFNIILGFISAFFGTGGGFLRTPVLVAAFSFPVRVAVATSVFALSIYATVGASVHAYLDHVDWYPTLFWTGLGLLGGSQIGVRIASTIKSKWLMRLLMGLLFVMGTKLLGEAAGFTIGM